MANEIPLLAQHMLMHPLSCVEGYHNVRAQACEAVAWFVNQWEAQGVEWRVILVAGNMRMSMRNLGEIASRLDTLRFSTHYAQARGRSGSIQVVSPDDLERIGAFGDDIIYLIDEGVRLEAIDRILARVAGRVKVIAVNPPSEKILVFTPLFREVNNANSAA